MRFQKVSTPPPPHRRSLEIPTGGGGCALKAKLLEEKYEAKLEFPGGGGEGEGCKMKTPSVGGI